MAPKMESEGAESSLGLDFDVLQLLLKAPSKDFVVRSFQDSFKYRDQKTPERIISKTAEMLQVSQEESVKLMTSITNLVKITVYDCMTDPREVYQLFPDNFHKSLRELLSKVIVDNMSSWRTEAVSSQVSLPRLADFDWRIDVKTASDTVSRMAVPTCLLQLQVENGCTSGQATRGFTRNLNVELTKETLDTMLDGLGKIRDQLSSVVTK